jgi:hypothetical protein
MFSNRKPPIKRERLLKCGTRDKAIKGQLDKADLGRVFSSSGFNRLRALLGISATVLAVEAISAFSDQQRETKREMVGEGGTLSAMFFSVEVDFLDRRVRKQSIFR